MNEKVYPAGQYVAGDNLELGDYLLKPEDDDGVVEMFVDYDHFVADDDFFHVGFKGDYRIALRKQGVVVVIWRAVCTRVKTEPDK